MPTMNYLRRDPHTGKIVPYGTSRSVKCREYGYQWEYQRQTRRNEQGDLPTRDGRSRQVLVAWTADPTPEEQALIENGAWTNPQSFCASDEVRSYIDHRHGGKIEIIHQQNQRFSGLTGVRFLQTCKKIAEEGTEILYATNKFVFNTAGVHLRDSLHEMPHRIPGLPNADGRPPTSRQINKSIDKIFDTACFHPKFIKYDPMIDFLRRIGKKNAGPLQRIKLEGTFKTYDGGTTDDFSPRPGFAKILSIDTLILGRVCTGLRELTLNIRTGKDIGERGYSVGYWDDEGDVEASEKHDMERIDGIVRNVVDGLPTLRKLRLGEYKVEMRVEGATDEWGKSIRWVDYVKERYAKRVKKEVQLSSASSASVSLLLRRQ